MFFAAALATIMVISLAMMMIIYRMKRKQIVTKQVVTAALPQDIARVRALIITDVASFLRHSWQEQHDVVFVVDSLLTTALERPEQLARLATFGPVYYVWHERDYKGNIHLADAHLREANVKVLSDQWARFEGETGQVLQIEGVDGLGNVPIDYSFSEIVAHHKWLVHTKHDKIKLTNEYSLVLQPFCLMYRAEMGQMVEWSFNRRDCAYSVEIVS